VQHTLSFIQTRGRARHVDSFFHYIYHTSTKEKERYIRIKQQEQKMLCSIEVLNDIIKKIGYNPYSNWGSKNPITLTPLWPYLWEYTDNNRILNIDKKLQDIINEEPKMVFNLTIKRFFNVDKVEEEEEKIGMPHAPIFGLTFYLKDIDRDYFQFSQDAIYPKKDNARFILCNMAATQLAYRDLIVYPNEWQFIKDRKVKKQEEIPAVGSLMDGQYPFTPQTAKSVLNFHLQFTNKMNIKLQYQSLQHPKSTINNPLWQSALEFEGKVYTSKEYKKKSDAENEVVYKICCSLFDVGELILNV